MKYLFAMIWLFSTAGFASDLDQYLQESDQENAQANGQMREKVRESRSLKEPVSTQEDRTFQVDVGVDYQDNPKGISTPRNEDHRVYDDPTWVDDELNDLNQDVERPKRRPASSHLPKLKN